MSEEGKQPDTKPDEKKEEKEAVESFSVIPQAEQRDNPAAAKIRIRRKGDEPVVCVTVSYRDEFCYWRPDAGRQVFDVDALTAAAAVATGGFEVDPKSRVKLKE